MYSPHLFIAARSHKRHEDWVQGDNTAIANHLHQTGHGETKKKKRERGGERERERERERQRQRQRQRERDRQTDRETDRDRDRKKKKKKTLVNSTCSLSFIKDSNTARLVYHSHSANANFCDRISPSPSIFQPKAQQNPPVTVKSGAAITPRVS